jgi:4-amino-4-deoxy-L-arabinose transferase-like glycosyltransferase
VPPLWWDEGWTLSVARNWLERDHYGRLLANELAPSGLQASPIVTASVYLSFRLFGVGVMQARIVGVVFTLLSMVLLYWLVRRIYNRSVALGTLFVLVFLPAYIELFPIYVGRQVLGEMPALAFLLGGYVSILFVSRHQLWTLTLATVCWSIALSTKLQVVPFWLCSMLVPILVSVYQRDWKSLLRWAVLLVGSLLGARALPVMWESILRSKADIADPISGLYEVTAAVGSIPARMFALIVVGLFGVPTILGITYAIRNVFKERNVLEWTSSEQVRFALLTFSSTWFAWFAVFSVGWIRYVFPATFMGSIFVAAMIYEFTGRHSLAYTVQQALAVFKGRGFTAATAGALVVIAIILTSFPRTAIGVYKTYLLDADVSVREVAAFVNSHTRSGSLIETYDSELFFLLNRPYHYPPDQIHVDLIRRTFLYEDETRINYDPLAADPDYLVVGPQSKKWRLYDEVLSSGAFRLIQSYKRYQIFERLR